MLATRYIAIHHVPLSSQRHLSSAELNLLLHEPHRRLNMYDTPGFCHCWSVRLEQSSRPCPQSDLHRSCFKVPAKDIFCSHGTSAPIAFEDSLPMRYANRHTDIDKQNCLPERIVLNMFHIHVFVQRETRTEST